MSQYLRLFQSTPSAWRETALGGFFLGLFVISIHSLRMEGDCTCTRNSRHSTNFNPLPPHGGRLSATTLRAVFRDFNPLPPHGGRLRRKFRPCGDRNFNPLPPHGGRPYALDSGVLYFWIFQSTPSAWRETRCFQNILLMFTFQSTPSAWRETLLFVLSHVIFIISIHSLRMEGDSVRIRIRQHTIHFNPLPPHGGRPAISASSPKPWHFNPLPPHGGRLCLPTEQLDRCDISIHSLRMEGDLNSEQLDAGKIHFNPLPPHGGRHT